MRRHYVYQPCGFHQKLLAVKHTHTQTAAYRSRSELFVFILERVERISISYHARTHTGERAHSLAHDYAWFWMIHPINLIFLSLSLSTYLSPSHFSRPKPHIQNSSAKFVRECVISSTLRCASHTTLYAAIKARRQHQWSFSIVLHSTDARINKRATVNDTAKKKHWSQWKFAKQKFVDFFSVSVFHIHFYT